MKCNACASGSGARSISWVNAGAAGGSDWRYHGQTSCVSSFASGKKERRRMAMAALAAAGRDGSRAALRLKQNIAQMTYM